MGLLGRFFTVCALLVIALFGLTHYRERYISTSDGHPLQSEARSYTVDEAKLSGHMQDILADNASLDIGIAVIDLQTGKRYQWGETASYASASLGKLVSATAYLHKIELGQGSLDDTLGNASGHEQLKKMIIESDNTAWRQVNQFVGAEALHTYAQAIDLQSYQPVDNILTSADAARLLEKLASYRLLNTEHTGMLLSLMKQANMRSYIVAAVPSQAETYHKVGYLKDRLHDVAIIKKGDRSYVLAIFTKVSGTYDFSKGGPLFGAITDATLQSFF